MYSRDPDWILATLFLLMFLFGLAMGTLLGMAIGT